MDRPYYRNAGLGLIVLAITCQCGCRTIGRFSESQQSITARRLSRLGLQAAHAGQWNTAESLFAEALEVSTTDDRAHAGLAESLWQRGEKEDAVTHMEQAVRLSAADPKHVLRLGQMYLEQERLEEAREQSVVALASERSSADAWVLRGDCLRAEGEYAQALAAYHRALAIRPDSPKAQLEAAEIYHLLQRYDRLLATIDRLQENVGTEQTPARADMLRGIAMRELGQGAEAKRCFARAAAKDPADPAPHLQLASLSLEGGDVATAREALAHAMRLDPSLRDRPSTLTLPDLPGEPAAPTQLAGPVDADDAAMGLRR